MASKGLRPLPRRRGSVLANGGDRSGRVVLPLARAAAVSTGLSIRVRVRVRVGVGVRVRVRVSGGVRGEQGHALFTLQQRSRVDQSVAGRPPVAELEPHADVGQAAGPRLRAGLGLGLGLGLG